ncbi:mucin-5AC-like [Ixodes scapularis]
MGGFSDTAFFATSVRLPRVPPPRTTNGSVRTDQGVTKRPSSATSSETTISATTSVDRFSGCGGQRSRMITPLFVIQIALLMGSLPPSLAGGTNIEKTDSTSIAAAGDTTQAMGGFSDRAFFATSVRLPRVPPPRTTNGSVRTDQGVTKRPSSATSSETTISATTSVDRFSGCGGQRSRMITPLFVIQPQMHPGECWAFRGSQGHLVVQLARRVRPTSFAVEHIPKELAVSGSLDSAPKDFHILGLDSETDHVGKLLGKYTYDLDGEPLQYFLVQDPDPGSFRFVEMKILSNHGHLEYTCLYRLRVHGVPSD